jgi:hypothetical protein
VAILGQQPSTFVKEEVEESKDLSSRLSNFVRFSALEERPTQKKKIKFVNGIYFVMLAYHGLIYKHTAVNSIFVWPKPRRIRCRFKYRSIAASSF